MLKHIKTCGLIMTVVISVGCTGNFQPTYAHNSYTVPIRKMPVTNNLYSLANQAANRYGIDYRLFHALIKHESAWNPRAISRAGARGLTQIMPKTGKYQCGLERDVLFDPRLNLNCGAFYLSKLLKRFKNVKLALAAYNSGETRVARLGRIPRIRETQRYVKKVMASYRGG
ncbi:lytic transglycosylase domain-containing protein [Candidatus Halobeggiatoa sp. HSG11]|nr:lytic transglycosylase domain-containing protein [Candidatus Halobeggiatoa sp. HSG11]